MLLIGDCIASMRTLADNSVDSIVTDPPYGLTANKKGGSGVASVNLESPYGRARIGTGNGSGGFMGLAWDAGVPPIEVWAECLRVLKPGGHLLAFAGTRTQHRMAVNIEDAGFEIRDMIAWVYGSGFPKSLDVSKAIDKAAGAEREVVAPPPYTRGKPTQRYSETRKVSYDCEPQPITAPATEAARQWQGWGTALKPALEPITVARKPLIGTVAANVLAHGTGAINVDGCRVPTDPSIDDPRMGGAGSWGTGKMAKNVYEGGYAGEVVGSSPLGRWPANLIHDGSDDVLAAFPQAPGQQGDLKNHDKDRKSPNGCFGKMAPARDHAARVESDKSAARFFYCAKASKKDRGEGNTHPTVKPTDLMRYLCRLVTPPGGVVLDPFMGSGSTGVAAILEGFDFIGCERDEAYFLIAKERVEAVKLW